MSLPSRRGLRAFVKLGLAWPATVVLPQAHPGRMILVLSHMRSASTALCNVLASHPDVSGYGETHVCHGDKFAPGRVLVNIARRRAFQPKSPFILDKILHNHLDDFSPETTSNARAIFLVRKPAPSVRSIYNLSQRSDLPEISSLQDAGRYYLDRIQRLESLWHRFPANHRIGLTSESLLRDPDQTLIGIGQWIGLSRSLDNTYASHPASTKGGGGDPIYSGRARKIEARSSEAVELESDLSLSIADELCCQHRRLVGHFQDNQSQHG